MAHLEQRLGNMVAVSIFQHIPENILTSELYAGKMLWDKWRGLGGGQVDEDLQFRQRQDFQPYWKTLNLDSLKALVI